MYSLSRLLLVHVHVHWNHKRVHKVQYYRISIIYHTQYVLYIIMCITILLYCSAVELPLELNSAKKQ
jgi:hypothetical protein